MMPRGYAPVNRGAYPGHAPMRFSRAVPVNHTRAPYTGARAANRGFGAGYGDRGRGGDRDHHRRPYYRGWGLGYGIGYPGWWPGYPFLLSSCILGCDAGDYGDYDNPYGYPAGYGAPDAGQYGGQYGDAMTQYPGYPAAPGYNYGSSEEYAQPPDGDASGNRPEYTGNVISNPPGQQQTLKVIMKDGQQLQVHNYMLTATTLTVLDENYRQIPLDQIDVNATRQQNLANGLDFRVPQAPRVTNPGQARPGSGSGGTTTPHNQLSALPPRA